MKPEGRRARMSCRSLSIAVIAAAIALLSGSPAGTFAQTSGKGPSKNAAAAVALPGARLDATHTVGAPLVHDNLAVFPIYASVQEDIGEFTTLDAALERGTAVVRELDPAAPRSAAGAGAPQVQQRGHHPPRHHGNAGNIAGDGAQVNTLVIENKGSLAILVLAGTVVKGGKQDRQIGEDFVVGAGKTVAVDAFCVEHGRWTTTRDGVATGGKFEATKTLATAKVRAAGQHQRSQSGVWAEVSAVNAANKKGAPSDTLMATLDDKEIAAKRAAIAAKAAAFFAGAPQSDRIVGLAYSIGGKVRGVRWFLSHKLFTLHRDTLVNTLAVEAITDAGAPKEPGKPGGGPSATGPVSAALAASAAPAAVVQFIADIQAAAVKEKRETQAGNVNEYRSSEKGYGSAAMMKPAPAAAPKAVTVDFVAK